MPTDTLTRCFPPKAQRAATTIWTDGGNRCNDPRNYGIGYGSFRVGDSEIVRVEFGEPMSNNAAEIRTICAALESAPELSHLLIVSDSQIALKWAKDAPRARILPSPKFSIGMLLAIERIRRVAVGRTIKIKWAPRAEIFAIFGH